MDVDQGGNCESLIPLILSSTLKPTLCRFDIVEGSHIYYLTIYLTDPEISFFYCCCCFLVSEFLPFSEWGIVCLQYSLSPFPERNYLTPGERVYRPSVGSTTSLLGKTMTHTG